MEKPDFFKPIYLLGIEGELCKQLILARLKVELMRTRNLSQR